MDELSDKELLEELGVSIKAKKVVARTPREERVIASFGDIVRFVEEHGRLPEHGEDRDIFERLYAVRLDRMRESSECRDLLNDIDSLGLLGDDANVRISEDPTDEELLSSLGTDAKRHDDVTRLVHVRPREEIRAAEEV